VLKPFNKRLVQDTIQYIHIYIIYLERITTSTTTQTETGHPLPRNKHHSNKHHQRHATTTTTTTSKNLKKLQRDHQKQPPTPKKNITFATHTLYVYYIITLNPQVSDKIYYLYENTNNDERVTHKEWSID